MKLKFIYCHINNIISAISLNFKISIENIGLNQKYTILSPQVFKSESCKSQEYFFFRELYLVQIKGDHQQPFKTKVYCHQHH